MNYFIFSPKGKIDKLCFALYHIFLMAFYLLYGILVFYPKYLTNGNLNISIVIQILTMILIVFNYKKKFLAYFNKFLPAILLAIIFTFDMFLIPFICKSKVALIIGLVFTLLIQPIIALLLPARGN